ncbi:hypothetical protein ACJJIL_12425 [Microbulbifer sp. EKSA005]|uniref:hypothetical protein n=1 Tax=Microbulbifer sp. EKSA005 TaxID=3243364 RepID=UPI0040427FDE
MMKTVELSTCLERNPYPDTLKSCLAQMLPLSTEQDYLALSSLPVNSSPVLLNHSEHYQLLLDILRYFEDSELDIDLILIKMQMPAGGRMPSALLQDTVLMLHDLAGEEAILVREGRRYIAIEDSLVRHPFEAGTNQLKIRLAVDIDCHDLLIEGLSKLLIECGFGDITINTMDGTA